MADLLKMAVAAVLSLGLISHARSQSIVVLRSKPLPAAPAGYAWKAIPEFSDEFDGPKLDAAKWLPYQPYWKGREPSQFEPQNVVVRGGRVDLRSTPAVESLTEVKNPEKDIWVHSACVSSKKPMALYGYYEARIKASRLPMTSSFWFQGKYSEIDVVEQLGASVTHPESGRNMAMNTHYFRDGWNNDRATPTGWKMPTGAAEEFHIYGVWWKNKDTVWFYHNGEKVAEVKPGGPFLEPMYLFFDTEVFAWEGFPTLESLRDAKKNTMSVDWVRSWKLVKTGQNARQGQTRVKPE